MARFDVFAGGADRALMLDVQSDMLETLNTRVVVPLLLERSAPQAAEVLNPVFEISDKRYVMVTQFMAAVPRKELKSLVARLDGRAAEIIGAVDFLHQGW